MSQHQGPHRQSLCMSLTLIKGRRWEQVDTSKGRVWLNALCWTSFNVWHRTIETCHDDADHETTWVWVYHLIGVFVRRKQAPLETAENVFQKRDTNFIAFGREHVISWNEQPLKEVLKVAIWHTTCKLVWLFSCRGGSNEPCLVSQFTTTLEYHTEGLNMAISLFTGCYESQ